MSWAAWPKDDPESRPRVAALCVSLLPADFSRAEIAGTMQIVLGVCFNAGNNNAICSAHSVTLIDHCPLYSDLINYVISSKNRWNDDDEDCPNYHCQTIPSKQPMIVFSNLYPHSHRLTGISNNIREITMNVAVPCILLGGELLVCGWCGELCVRREFRLCVGPL